MLELNKIYNESCLETMAKMSDDFLQCIVTSPPYNIGAGGSAFKFKGYDKYNDKNSEYDSFILKVLNELYRVLKPGGSLFFNHKVRTVNKIAIHPLKLIFSSKFELKQEIVWDLHDTHIHNKDRFYPINEMIYWLIKDSAKTEFNSDFSNLTTIWRMNRANKKEEGCQNHPAPFTLELPKRCILSTSKEQDIVYDPFFGSGSVGVICKQYNRNWIGSDISEFYCNDAQDRINI